MSDLYLGEIRMFAGDYAPSGWAVCHGQELQIAEYQRLYELIGTTYGGDGVTTFKLPDLSSRVPVHQGYSSWGTQYDVGGTGGVEQVTLSNAQIPSHTHPLHATEAPADQLTPLGNMPAEAAKRFYVAPAALTAMAPAAVSLAGESRPHTNMQPYLAVNFIIALDGTSPRSN